MHLSLHEVDTFIDELKPWQKQQFVMARNILHTFPEIREVYRYGIPFYDCNGMMLYFSLFKKKHADIGFVNGFMMKNELGILQAKHGQTQIRHWELIEEKEFDEILFIQLIEEAMYINQQIKKSNK
jgi:hypothetical protein